MTKSDWMHDLRAVDEVVIMSGEKMQNNDEMRGWWTIIYTLAVAAWHLLDAEIRRRENAEKG